MQSETHSTDPESTSAQAGGGASALGDYAQLEALLAGRMKTLESELAGLRRDLHESRRLEVRHSVYVDQRQFMCALVCFGDHDNIFVVYVVVVRIPQIVTCHRRQVRRLSWG